MHIKIYEVALFSHNHAACGACPVNLQGCLQVQDDIQGLMDRRELIVTKKDRSLCFITLEFHILEWIKVTFDSGKLAVTLLVICLLGPLPYTFERAIPYKYNATILEDGQKRPIPPLASVVSIVDSSKVLRSEHILPTTVQGKTSALVVEQVQAQDPGKSKDVGQSSVNINSDFDEVCKMIKRSEYKIVDQMLQTPSKISMLSLLMNSDAHR